MISSSGSGFGIGVISSSGSGIGECGGGPLAGGRDSVFGLMIGGGLSSGGEEGDREIEVGFFRRALRLGDMGFCSRLVMGLSLDTVT